jgi:hypothetical protein
MGEVWGPMSALELYTVARRGRLSRDDFVRNGFDGEWARAETVHGLFDEPNPSTGARRITVPVRRGPVPRPASRTNAAPSERYWVRHEGEIAGPFSRRQVLRLAATGKLKPEFLLSRNRREWLRIADIEALALPNHEHDRRLLES